MGQALLNVVDGRIGTFELHDAVKNDADGTLLEQWLLDFLKWDEKRMVNPNSFRGRCRYD